MLYWLTTVLHHFSTLFPQSVCTGKRHATTNKIVSNFLSVISILRYQRLANALFQFHEMLEHCVQATPARFGVEY